MAAPLTEAQRQSLAQALNHLLANYQMHYQNLRGYHWNVQGRDFFTLHLQFEQYYTAAALLIDTIAERILALGHTPLHSFAEYAQLAEVKAHTNVSDGATAVKQVAEQTQVLLHHLRSVQQLASQHGDEGTSDFVTTEIGLMEKRAWMLAAYLKD